MYHLVHITSHNLPYEKVGKNEPVCIADEVPFEIPESWEWVRLGEFFQHNTGKALNSSNRSGELLTYITTSNLYWNRFEIDNLREMYFSETEIPKCTATKGDLLVCEGGDIGRAAIWPYDTDIRIQNHIHRLRAYSEVCVEYYLCIFFLYKHAGWIGGKGIGIQGLSSNALHSLLFPLPPLQEQRRIVTKIKETAPFLEKYEQIEQHLNDLNVMFPEMLKKSILQEAIQGKLVPQDPSDKPASGLLERIRAEKEWMIKEGKIKRDKHESIIYRRDNSHYEKRGSEEVCIDDEIPFEIPKNWAWTRLKNICSLIGDIDHNMPKSVSADVGVLFLSAKDLLDDGTINYTQNVKYISRADFERLSRKALPQKHDIIYSRIGAALGKARLVEIDREFLVSYSCCVVRPLLVYAPYIRYYLESPQILLHSIKARQSIGVPDLGMGEIKKYLVALPPYNEQVRIVEQLEILLDRCDFKK